MAGINLVHRENPAAAALKAWYNGPTLVDLLGELTVNPSDRNLLNYSNRSVRASYTGHHRSFEVPNCQRLQRTNIWYCGLW